MLHHLAVRGTNLGLVDARRTLAAPTHSANCRWVEGVNGRGLVAWFGLGPLLPVKGYLNAKIKSNFICHMRRIQQV